MNRKELREKLIKFKILPTMSDYSKIECEFFDTYVKHINFKSGSDWLELMDDEWNDFSYKYKKLMNEYKELRKKLIELKELPKIATMYGILNMVTIDENGVTFENGDVKNFDDFSNIDWHCLKHHYALYSFTKDH